MDFKKGFILLSVLASLASGQSFDVSGLGLANNAVATGRGLDAFWRNPANLGYKNDAFIEISPFAFNLLAANNSLSLNDYSRYFTKAGNGGQWSAQDQKDVLALFPAAGFRLDANVQANIFNITVGTYGLGVSVMARGGVEIKSKKALDLALNGLELTDSYNFSEPEFARGGAYGAIKISAGYGQLLKTKFRKWDIDNISVGAKLNYYIGMAVLQAVNSDVLVQRSASGDGFKKERITSQVHLKWRSAYSSASFSSGSGLGIDLGASAVYKKNWYFSAVFENIGASINWSGNTRIQEFVQFDTLFFNGDTSQAQSPLDTSYATGSFKTSLPSYLIVGAQYNLWSNLSLMAQWRQALSSDFGEVLTPQVGVAVEYYPIPIVPVRSGITLGGRDGFVFALGSGLHLKLFELDVSYAMRNGLWPFSAEGAYAAMGIKFRF